MSEKFNDGINGEENNAKEWEGMEDTQESTPETSTEETTPEETVEEPQDDLRAKISDANEAKATPEPQRFVLPDGRVIYGDSDDYKQALIDMREAK